jgi:antitoxin HicB
MAQKEIIPTQEYTYTVLLERDEEAGGFVATCPALPGLVTEGDTLAEARAMAADAIRGYLESLRKHGDPIPPGETCGSDGIRDSVTVTLKRV